MRAKLCKTLLILGLTISTYCAFGQDSIRTEKKIKEYFFTLADISPLNISIKYKQQIKNRTFLKIGLINISASTNTYVSNSSTYYPRYQHDFSAGLESGLEFRRIITEKFTFFHGLNLNFTYIESIHREENPAFPINQSRAISKTYKGGIPYTLGLLFQLNNHFVFSAEINPELFFSYKANVYEYSSQSNSKNISTGFLFANRNGGLSIAYRL